jgi:uncharacterized protein
MMSLLAPLLGASSCGGKVGETLRPHEHSAREALGGGKAVACTGEAAYARPLIVDLDPDARVDLEAGLESGVVVVSYDCTSLRVLTNCKLAESSYAYAGVSRKEQVVQITSADDLHANLPLSQVKLSAELLSGRSIDLGLVLVGRRSTTVGELARDQLTGTCAGATHFVQNATLGAFSMVTGSVGKAAIVAEVFSYGAAAKSESERKAVTNDGSLDSCRGSDPAAIEPPSECRAPLRIELVPIVAKRSVGARGADGETREKAPVAQRNPCPSGFRDVDGLCTVAPTEAYLCDPHDPADCAAQCEKGSAESCYNYGVALQDEHKVDDALPFYLKACAGDVADACGAYGHFAVSIDEGAVGLAMNRKVLALVDKGCKLGSARACNVAGDLRHDKEYKMIDLVTAAGSYERGCALGDNEACFSSSQVLFRGEGVAADPAAGVAVLRRACQGGDGSMCYELANVLGNARYGAAKDPAAAYLAISSACRADPDFCIDASRSAAKLGKDDESFAHAKRGCDHDDADSCVRLGDLYRDGRGTTKDPARAKQAWTKSCDGGSSDGDEVACKRLGIKMKG